MQEAAAWAGPRFQLTHSAAKGSGERTVLCSGSGVLLEASKTQLPSVAPVSVRACRQNEHPVQHSQYVEDTARSPCAWLLGMQSWGQRRRKGKRYLGAGSPFWDVQAFRLSRDIAIHDPHVCLPASSGWGEPVALCQMLC